MTETDKHHQQQQQTPSIAHTSLAEVKRSNRQA